MLTFILLNFVNHIQILTIKILFASGAGVYFSSTDSKGLDIMILGAVSKNP